MQQIIKEEEEEQEEVDPSEAQPMEANRALPVNLLFRHAGVNRERLRKEEPGVPTLTLWAWHLRQPRKRRRKRKE